MPTDRMSSVALLWRGDRDAREGVTAENNRLRPIFDALSEVGIAAQPAVYDEDFGGEVYEQLLSVDAVLVWVDPVSGGKDRAALDALLREVSAKGVWVSAHPDVILKMGTKEVLYQTRALGWGSDTDVYRSPAELQAGLPARLATGPRVLKQYRGNGGIGVLKVELDSGDGDEARVRVQSARNRDDTVEVLSVSELMARAEKYFGYANGEGRLIDQAFQPTISRGLVRCYLVKDEVVGFSRQQPDPAISPERVFGLPGAKTMFGPDEPTLERLRHLVETEWVPAMQALVDVDTRSLPVLWDADFLFGADDNSYVLSEINVSAVAPFPEHAIAKLAAAVRHRLS